MFTDYNVRRKKLSFSYTIQFKFNDDYFYTDKSENSLLKKRTAAFVRFLSGGCSYEYIEKIDRELKHQHYLYQSLDNVNNFSKDSLNNYDAEFLSKFARDNLSIDPFKFVKSVPIFEIENMVFNVYMPLVDEFGHIKVDGNRVGNVTIIAEITVITVDTSLEDFNNYAQQVFMAIYTSGIGAENCKIDDVGEVNECCTIVTKIKECIDSMKIYGYHDTPKSPEMKRNELLFTEPNQEFARRLYCGKVWTRDALEFAKTYYQHHN